MHPAVQIILTIALVVLMVTLYPALLVIALIALLLWLFSNLTTHGPVWFLWQRDATVLRMGRFPWFRRVPGITPILRRVERQEAEREAERERKAEEERRREAEREVERAREAEEQRRREAKREVESARQAEKERRRKAEADAREQAERDKARKEREEFINRPIPPDIKGDMRAFLDGSLVGEDRSPLAYVGYRVGKTRGLIDHERRKRLDVCFRIEIPPDLDAKYQGWGAPATYRRFRSIDKHLKMLADMRGSRSNQRFAVADWKADRTWFRAEYRSLADRLQRRPPRRRW